MPDKTQEQVQAELDMAVAKASVTAPVFSDTFNVTTTKDGITFIRFYSRTHTGEVVHSASVAMTTQGAARLAGFITLIIQGKQPNKKSKQSIN